MPLPGGKWSSACPRCLIEAFGEEEQADPADGLVAGYTIIEEVSRGGMGVIYRAQQHHPSRVVALKMILPHLLDSPVIRARFQAEAESVAKLDHPNVLPIYEAGENRGTPYLAMKFVAGGSVDAQRAKFLGAPRACAELVAAAARGVQHAHERGILHRDLKPANLLLDSPAAEAAPIPMVSDFGLARILEAEPSGLTSPSAFLGTIGYLAPELAFGSRSSPTVQADIYSLGAILYELLVGQLPFGTETGLEALRRADREAPPSLRTLDPRIPKDLDAICLACLQREPSSRYRTAGALADDLDRFLEGSPVLARKDTFGYRAEKFARRNKAGLAVAALVLLLLVGGIIATSRQAHIAMREKARAERRFSEVRKLANSVLFDYHDAIKALPGATKVRERLVKDALSYLDSLAGEARGDPALQRELAAAYERVGDVRGGQSSGSLGDRAGAVESYTKALRIREALAAVNPKDAQARRDLATSHQKLGCRLRSTSEDSVGWEHLQKALALFLDLAREQPANDELQLDLADIRGNVGGALSLRDDRVGELEQDRAALEIREKLFASHPRDQTYRRELWKSHVSISYDLWLQNDVAGALETNSKAIALGEALIVDDPNNADYRRGMMLNYQNRGDYLRQSDSQSALECFRRELALGEELLAADPANALTLKDLAYTHKKIADLLLELKDDSQALLHFSKALENYEKVVTDSPEDLISHFLVATCQAGVARMQARRGEVDLALEECRKAIALLQEITGDKKGHLGRAQAHEYLGHAYFALAESPKASASEIRERMSAARDMFQQALNIIDDLRSQGPLGANEQWAQEIAGEMAECDGALAK
ncbi:MAG: protein kinase [Verrucomicrobiota bacterium]|nr:protein kinase [Verrucomicrobiota bacterium]